MKTTFFTLAINSKYTTLYAGTLEEFMEHDPPCKECLVQAACIKTNEYEYIIIHTCDIIKKFMNKSKYFY